MVVNWFAVQFHRWKNDRRARASDAPLLAAVVLFILSMLLRSPFAELLYFAERAQLVGWLLVAVWLGASPASSRWLNVALLMFLTACALRMVYIERRMNLTSTDDRLAVEAVAHFEPHSMVIPVVLDHNWLTHHTTAYVALAHNGVVLTSRDHVGFTWDTRPPIELLSYLEAPENDWQWFTPYLSKHASPRIAHVVVFGRERPVDDPKWRTLSIALAAYFTESFTNGYATVYTRKKQ